MQAMLLILAFALDVGNWYVHERQLQNRVDNAAFAAALAYGYRFPGLHRPDATRSRTTIVDSAKQYAGDDSASARVNTDVNDPAQRQRRGQRHEPQRRRRVADGGNSCASSTTTRPRATSRARTAATGSTSRRARRTSSACSAASASASRRSPRAPESASWTSRPRPTCSRSSSPTRPTRLCAWAHLRMPTATRDQFSSSTVGDGATPGRAGPRDVHQAERQPPPPSPSSVEARAMACARDARYLGRRRLRAYDNGDHSRDVENVTLIGRHAACANGDYVSRETVGDPSTRHRRRGIVSSRGTASAAPIAGPRASQLGAGPGSRLTGGPHAIWSGDLPRSTPATAVRSTRLPARRACWSPRTASRGRRHDASFVTAATIMAGDEPPEGPIAVPSARRRSNDRSAEKRHAVGETIAARPPPAAERRARRPRVVIRGGASQRARYLSGAVYCGGATSASRQRCDRVRLHGPVRVRGAVVRLATSGPTCRGDTTPLRASPARTTRPGAARRTTGRNTRPAIPRDDPRLIVVAVNRPGARVRRPGSRQLPSRSTALPPSTSPAGTGPAAARNPVAAPNEDSRRHRDEHEPRRGRSGGTSSSSSAAQHGDPGEYARPGRPHGRRPTPATSRRAWLRSCGRHTIEDW